MINENFINFSYKPEYIDHDDVYVHKHHHTPARLASHEYKECMHKKNNEKECKEQSLKVYEDNISAEQKYKNCRSNARTGLDKTFCEKTFNKDNKYSYTSLYSTYTTTALQYCMKDEMEKNIKKNCGNCEQKSKNSDSSIAEDMYYKICIKNKESCEKKYDNAKKCIDDLKKGEPETQECLQDVRYNLSYGQCYEQKGFSIGDFLVKILFYFLGPMINGPFYFIYFMFILLSVLFFGGIFFACIWLLVLFMYTVLGNNARRAFPGMIIFELINQYFRLIHPIVLKISGLLWAFFFGLCLILYFLHKFFGWWPLSILWEPFRMFPENSKTVFDWFDRLIFGCGIRSSARKTLFCHTNSMWILMEDWMVDFAQNTLKIDKSEVELRNAINAFRDLGAEDIKIAYSMKKMAEESKNAAQKKGKQIVSEQINNITEEFTVFDKKNKCIEENFMLEDIFDKDFYMNEIDKVSTGFDNFKNVYNAVKDRTLNDYGSAKSNAEREKESCNSCEKCEK